MLPKTGIRLPQPQCRQGHYIPDIHVGLDLTGAGGGEGGRARGGKSEDSLEVFCAP